MKVITSDCVTKLFKKDLIEVKIETLCTREKGTIGTKLHRGPFLVFGVLDRNFSSRRQQCIFFFSSN